MVITCRIEKWRLWHIALTFSENYHISPSKERWKYVLKLLSFWIFDPFQENFHPLRPSKPFQLYPKNFLKSTVFQTLNNKMNFPKQFKEFISLQKPTVKQEPDHLRMTKIKPSLNTTTTLALLEKIFHLTNSFPYLILPNNNMKQLEALTKNMPIILEAIFSQEKDL
jgi:hypothetical protein